MFCFDYSAPVRSQRLHTEVVLREGKYNLRNLSPGTFLASLVLVTDFLFLFYHFMKMELFGFMFTNLSIRVLEMELGFFFLFEMIDQPMFASFSVLSGFMGCLLLRIRSV